MLPNEEEQFEDIRTLLQQSYSAPSLSDQFAHRLEERLRTLLPVERKLSEPVMPWYRIVHRIGKLNMRQRITLGAVGIIAILAMLLLWLGSIASPVSAMEKMAENIRKAKSYKCTHIVQMIYSEPGKPSKIIESIFTVYWLAPGSSRSEKIHTSPQTWKGAGPEETEIRPLGKPGISIYHHEKKFSRYPTLQKPAFSSTFDDLENLGKFTGKASHELGTKEIGGRKVRGFQIDQKEMNPDAEPGLAEIWIDIESNLPVLVRYDDMKGLEYRWNQEDKDIQWNIDLDPKLFETTPPEGYTDDTPKMPTIEEQVLQIVEALRIYAEASGGYYPQKNRIESSDASEELCKLFGMSKWPTLEQAQTGGNPAKVIKAFKGFNQMNRIGSYQPEFAYYGKSVEPKDNDKVLVRWKLDDGQYKVIFGNLHDETVSADKLRDLEKN